MKNSFSNAIIIILIIAVVGLSLILIQNQRTIKSQQATIAAQHQQIEELNTKVAELSAASPENILRLTKEFAKEKGASFLNQILQGK